MKPWLARLLQLAALLLTLALPARAAPLIDAAGLRQALAGPTPPLLLDASVTPLYRAKHIAGALSVDLYVHGVTDLAPAVMEQRMRAWGVRAGRDIVIYDQGGSMMATWLFHELYYHGVPAERLRILDGGLAKWQAEGGAVTQEPSPAPAPGDFRVGALRQDARVGLEEFLAASGDPVNNALPEALEPVYHFGGARFFDRAGHVPNAILLPSADFYNADKTFKSPQELRRMLDYLGIRPGQQVLPHCGGGVAASVPFFALRFLLDYPRVRLFKGSQREWLRDERRLPYWTYDAPALLRERDWLQGFNGLMLRMYSDTGIAVLDLRSAEQHRQGHPPGARHLDAGLLRAALADPSALAAALGAIGLDPAQEAVLVGRGLDRDSALAFVLLQRLGQRKVSVLLDTVDDWALAGLPLEKPGAAAPAAAAARSYPVRPGTEGPGLYPRVYLSAAAQPPARGPDGAAVLHVPHQELLTPAGRPKPAPELWQILSKAGLPRYAEITLLAGDDPGAAALAYLVLKLMGYPDVRLSIA